MRTPRRLRPENLNAEAKQLAALEARKRGLTWQKAAKEAGYVNGSGALKAVAVLLSRMRVDMQESIDEYRQIEAARLESQLVRLNGIAQANESVDPAIAIRAIDSAIRLSARLSTLLGLDAPTKQEVTGANGGPIAIDDARARLADAIAKLVAEPDTGTDSRGTG